MERAINTIYDPGAPGVPLLAFGFSPRSRPSRRDIAQWADAASFPIVHDPGEAHDWVEVLIDGLSFEIAGMAPSPAMPTPGIAHRFGLGENAPEPGWEMLVLRPGPHLAAGASMPPVVRACTQLALSLADHCEAQAIVWVPGRFALSPAYFAEVAGEWLAGGPFPALGYTALVPLREGGLTSEGLEFFIGQEIEIASSPGDERQNLARLAVRAIDALVRHGAVEAAIELTGPSGEAIRLVPSTDGRTVRLTMADRR